VPVWALLLLVLLLALLPHLTLLQRASRLLLPELASSSLSLPLLLLPGLLLLGLGLLLRLLLAAVAEAGWKMPL
jgi:hypothetical protein